MRHTPCTSAPLLSICANAQMVFVRKKYFATTSQQIKKLASISLSRQSGLQEMQFDDVLVVQDVGQLDVLAVVDAGAPDSGGLELLS